MSKKWVYSFKEGDMSMRNLLGGKGANLAEMTNLGMPVHNIMKMDARSMMRLWLRLWTA